MVFVGPPPFFDWFSFDFMSFTPREQMWICGMADGASNTWCARTLDHPVLASATENDDDDGHTRGQWMSDGRVD